MAKFNDMHPINQTWDQLLNLATAQEANLDRDSDDVRQAFQATMVTAASVPTAGGTAAADSVPTATKKVTKYCFIHGKRSHHTSAQ